MLLIVINSVYIMVIFTMIAVCAQVVTMSMKYQLLMVNWCLILMMCYEKCDFPFRYCYSGIHPFRESCFLLLGGKATEFPALRKMIKI